MSDELVTVRCPTCGRTQTWLATVLRDAQRRGEELRVSCGACGDLVIDIEGA